MFRPPAVSNDPQQYEVQVTLEDPLHPGTILQSWQVPSSELISEKFVSFWLDVPYQGNQFLLHITSDYIGDQTFALHGSREDVFPGVVVLTDSEGKMGDPSFIIDGLLSSSVKITLKQTAIYFLILVPLWVFGWVFFPRVALLFHNSKKRDKILLALLVGFWLSLGILNLILSPRVFGIYQIYDGMVYAIVMAAISTALWFMSLRFGLLDRAFSKATQVLSPGNLLHNRPFQLFLLVVVGTTVAGIVLDKPLDFNFGVHRWMFVLAFGLSGYFILCFRKKPEKLFLALAITIGLMYSLTQPIFHPSWDEEFHYPTSVMHSFIGEAYYTENTQMIQTASWRVNVDYYGAEERTAYIAAIDSLAERGFTSSVEQAETKYYSWISYIPYGIVLFITRSIGVSATYSYLIGRTAGVIVYAVVIFFALKRLRTGKYLVAVISLIPTAMFLASSYGYDYWVTAFTVLGFSYLFREWQEPDRPIDKQSVIIMLGAFIIGLAPKQIYFPLMFSLYFLSKSKFQNQQAYRRYLLIVTLCIGFVVGSFVLPIVTGFHVVTDVRGGDNVSAPDQIKYILSAPFTYFQIVLRAILNLFKPSQLHQFTTFFAYLGNMVSPFHLVVISTLLITALTDRNQYDKAKLHWSQRVGVFGSAFATLVLICTALYVGYVNVGSDTINGVQPRYIIPLLFPVLAMLRLDRLKLKIPLAVYSIAIYGSMAFTLLYGYWFLVAQHYH